MDRSWPIPSLENVPKIKCLEIMEDSLLFRSRKSAKYKSEQMSLSRLKNGLSLSKFFPPFLSIVGCVLRGLSPVFVAMSPVASTLWKASLQRQYLLLSCLRPWVSVRSGFEPVASVRQTSAYPIEDSGFIIHNREIKIHVYPKWQTWICTTWPSFPLNFRFLFITSTQK